MEIEVKMPDLSTTGGELTVLKWLVDVGSSVDRGDALFEVETDKATMDVESAHAGVLKKQLVQANATVLPGEAIAIIEVQQTKASAPGTTGDPPARRVPQPVGQDNAGRPNAKAISEATGQRVGMFARNRANRKDANATTSPLSLTQRIIARRMVQSKQSIPHYYLQTSACLDSICERRAECDDAKIAWDAFFVCAVAQSLKRFPKMGCRFQDDCLVFQPREVIGVAVDVAGELYIVPIADATTKTAARVSQEIRAACQKLKAGANDELKRLRPADFTITNLGMTVVESFVPIINSPEVAILGIGRVQPQPVVVESCVVVQQRATLTLAVDHRVVNGKYAAEFLSDLVEQLENS